MQGIGTLRNPVRAGLPGMTASGAPVRARAAIDLGALRHNFNQRVGWRAQVSRYGRQSKRTPTGMGPCR